MVYLKTAIVKFMNEMLVETFFLFKTKMFMLSCIVLHMKIKKRTFLWYAILNKDYIYRTQVRYTSVCLYDGFQHSCT